MNRLQTVVGAVALGVGLIVGSQAQAADEFPLRAQYALVGVKPLDTEVLTKDRAKFTVVDVRSAYEYQTLHIAGAVSVPLTSPKFVDSLKSLSAQDKKPLVFYCNGTTCEKSYKAASDALAAGIKPVWVYDAGIFAWAKVNPAQTVLLGKPMTSASQLISKADFEAHLLSPQEIDARLAKEPNAIVLDVRDAEQRAGISLFQMKDIHVPLDSPKLIEWVDKAKAEHRPLYCIDATGHQVQWLQYVLQERGLTQYWFVRGGARALYESLK
ncbi:rhodanese-like domain-containing protein [Halothiobacillus sp. DCM-1]|uniref:rhodanese-like domain-containing protein n=1 Tax=Halothiobacillus sp. DCM-1 TaxID=3112558 RepID=UPI00324FB3CC